MAALPYTGANARPLDYDEPEPAAPPSFIGQALRVVQPHTVGAKQKFTRGLSRRWSAFKAISGSIFGLGCLTAAAFTWTGTMGLVAAGLSCLILEYRVRG